ncbi:MAG: hypothetical protein H7Y38_03550, partial [Armatimonadetes bacterium]|nr:hypothetical protein [Armatimonadota bacterium]
MVKLLQLYCPTKETPTVSLTRRQLVAALPYSVLLLSPLACAESVAESQEKATAPPPSVKPLPDKTKVRATLGINLNGTADWNSELPFVDVFRQSRPWISQREGESWGKGPALSVDKNGYVTKLEPGCFAESPLCTIEGDHYPSGEYVVLYDGVGKFAANNATVVSETPGRMVLNVDAKRGGFFLQLRETDPANYVKNIRVLMPGFEKTYKTAPFHPLFLARWRGVACLRFMDWMHTNGSAQGKWSERPTLASMTFSEKGVALETMCSLSNTLGADAWVCIPHKADDEYVREFARLMKAKLSPNLRVYVEYSNEVWNGQFEQSRYAGEKGLAAKIGEKPWDAGWHYTARRSVEIFKIWEKEWGGLNRLVRVLPTQAGNAYVAEQIVAFEDAYKNADALAIAPYFGCAPGNAPDSKPNAATVEKWSVNDALDYLEKTALPESLKFVADNKAVADKFKLKLICYEGGQHMVGIQGAENNDAITKLFHDANRHPRMGKIYTAFLTEYTKMGGDVFCAFASTGGWSKWGAWGATQWYNETAKSSPKLSALVEWAKAQGQPMTL